MDTSASQTIAQTRLPGLQESWQIVASQLRMEMHRADYETWVAPLRPMGFSEGVYRLGAYNSYALDWVESRLRSRITRLLEGLLLQPVTLKFALISDTTQHAEPPAAPAERLPEPPVESPEKKRPQPSAEKGEGAGSARKLQLQRAYGTERARVIQPERGMFLTNYLFSNWLPLLGHSAFAVILAARGLCYWNPMTGELRNVVETDMSELARRANVSVRTIKDVLNQDYVRRNFLRYKVRRIMTPNGVRTAGIILQVRMDDPLTPEDQQAHNLPEEEHWFTPDFEDEQSGDGLAS